VASKDIVDSDMHRRCLPQVITCLLEYLHAIGGKSRKGVRATST
jgi:hypothetical protein